MVTVSTRYCFILIMDIQKEQWFAEAIKRYQKPLQNFAYGILRDLERTQEAVQDTFLRLWKQDMEEVNDKLAPWLFTVCRNRALHRWRHEKRYVPLSHEEEDKKHLMLPTLTASPAEDLELKEQIALLTVARKKLSKKYKRVLFLRYDEDLSYAEISAKTGLSTGHIGFILNDIKRRLRAALVPQDT